MESQQNIPPEFIPYLQLQRAEKQRFILGTLTPSDLLYSKYTPCGIYFRALQNLQNKTKDFSVDRYGKIYNTRKNYQDPGLEGGVEGGVEAAFGINKSGASESKNKSVHVSGHPYAPSSVSTSSTTPGTFVTQQTLNPSKVFESGTAPASQRLHNLSDPILALKQQFVNCVNENREFYAIRESNMLEWMYHSAEMTDGL